MIKCVGRYGADIDITRVIESHGKRWMYIITRKRLNDFAEKYPDATPALRHWYKLMKAGHFKSFAELRRIFPGADQVGKLTVFNIGGGKARLIAAIHYNREVTAQPLSADEFRVSLSSYTVRRFTCAPC